MMRKMLIITSLAIAHIEPMMAMEDRKPCEKKRITGFSNHIKKAIERNEEQIKQLEEKVKLNPLDPSIDLFINDIIQTDEFLKKNYPSEFDEKFSQLCTVVDIIKRAKEREMKKGKTEH